VQQTQNWCGSEVAKVTAEKKLVVLGKDEILLNESLAELKDAWQKPLKW